jgi:DNA-binding NarL/FixJ family response regulator
MPLMILVADDNLGTRLSVSDYLEMSGYSVITAEDGQDALSKIENYHPHVIVTDINMPRMDGYELVARVREKPPFRLLPVVFLTERTSTQERIKGYQSGCDSYLPKPFEMEELGAIVRNLLERSQMIQSEWRFCSPEDRLDSDLTSDNTSAETNLSRHNTVELTERQKEVLDLLARGLSNVEIGKQMHLSDRTIEKHVSSLLRQTETNNRAELVRFALENGLLD